MHYLDHEKLDCFHVATQALTLVEEITQSMPIGYAKLKDQMSRAALAVPLLIGEASARTGADRANRFKMARAEAGEVGAALTCAVLLKVARKDKCDEARELILRISAMLWPLTRRR